MASAEREEGSGGGGGVGRYRAGDGTVSPLESCGCHSDACGSVIVSPMRDAVELGATVTTDDGDVPMDLPDGSKSSNSMQAHIVTSHAEGRS